MQYILNPPSSLNAVIKLPSSLYIRICHTLKCIVHILVLLNRLFKIFKQIENCLVYIEDPAASSKFRGRCGSKQRITSSSKFMVQNRLEVLVGSSLRMLGKPGSSLRKPDDLSHLATQILFFLSQQLASTQPGFWSIWPVFSSKTHRSQRTRSTPCKVKKNK